VPDADLVFMKTPDGGLPIDLIGGVRY